MADPRHHPILRYLRQVLGASAGSGVSDAELLRRFVEEHDEAAFELLLWRHAAMVLHVCRQVLRDAEAVEDAFQATFLVFVRKAGSIGRKEALGGWLYRVAYHTALKSRQQIAKRKSAERELKGVDLPAASADSADLRELRRMICEEVNRLPARYRSAIVACFFEGKTHEEAARQLGWPRGTVASRLARGRELLRRRLLRRGVTLPAAVFTAALSVPTSSAALTGMIQSTIQTAKIFSVGQSASAALSPHVAALVEGVLKAMYWTRVKIVMVVLLIAGLGGAGATFWGMPRSAAEPPSESAPRAKAARGRDKEQPQEDVDKLARDMAQSRLNLRRLAQAMRVYAKEHGHFPPPAIYGKDGKALLSWRVALLPYLDQNNLYKLFHLDEPWDSPHNRGLSETTIVKVFAPVGKPEAPRFRTYYQVFVSPARETGKWKRVMQGGDISPIDRNRFVLLLDDGRVESAFVKGCKTRLSEHFLDGTVNTLLIVEAGNSVPWTKPEDLHYAADEPLPELGGLFRDVFHAAFTDGEVHTVTKKYDEKQLRAAITANGGEKLDWSKIEARNRSEDGKDAEAKERRESNDTLWWRLTEARQRVQLLKEELTVRRERFGGEDNTALQEELKKLQTEIERLNGEIRRWQKPASKKAP
ncbi:MAG TPA: sigma-70 family RNA polymerase sigma factor [Gemmataceae bacterium]|jgi:RNA polymerase sigma factor (sigma-70 family)